MEGGRSNFLYPLPQYRLPPPANLKEDVPYDAFEDFGGDALEGDKLEHVALVPSYCPAMLLIPKKEFHFYDEPFARDGAGRDWTTPQSDLESV